MGVPMPPAIVLIVCKTVLAGEPDINAGFTGWEPREWAVEDGKLQCRRHEIQLFDQAAAQGADSQPFTQDACNRAGIMAGANWDASHRKYKFFRVACPTPIVDSRTGETVAWQMPECGNRDVMICEKDTPI